MPPFDAVLAERNPEFGNDGREFSVAGHALAGMTGGIGELPKQAPGGVHD